MDIDGLNIDHVDVTLMFKLSTGIEMLRFSAELYQRSLWENSPLIIQDAAADHRQSHSFERGYDNPSKAVADNATE